MFVALLLQHSVADSAHAVQQAGAGRMFASGCLGYSTTCSVHAI
jgi:nitrate/nitrite-specific signal transduction histidine kinase